MRCSDASTLQRATVPGAERDDCPDGLPTVDKTTLGRRLVDIASATMRKPTARTQRILSPHGRQEAVRSEFKL